MDIDKTKNKIVILENDLINLIRAELIKDGYTKSVKLLIRKENNEVIRTISDIFDGHELTLKISQEEIYNLIKRAYDDYGKVVKDIKYIDRSYGSSYEILYDVKELVYRK